MVSLFLKADRVVVYVMNKNGIVDSQRMLAHGVDLTCQREHRERSRGHDGHAERGQGCGHGGGKDLSPQKGKGKVKKATIRQL
jgi:hypothetical protein